MIRILKLSLLIEELVVSKRMQYTKMNWYMNNYKKSDLGAQIRRILL
jgi:hypothetical protein